jgi:hypothetical protein
MPVDPEMLARFREYERAMEGREDPEIDLSALTSIPEVLAYLATSARHNGHSAEEAADQVELVVTLAGLHRDKLRAAARTLQPLGYHAVADRLVQLARSRRRKTLKPDQKIGGTVP